MKSWHHTRICAAGGWLAVLLCLLCVTPSAQPLGRPSAAGAGAGAGAAECSLYILGGEGSIRHAGMRCTGPQPTIALALPDLAGFKSNFTGVALNSSCGGRSPANISCLVSICAGRLLIRSSSVSLVRGVSVRTAVCVLGTSQVEVHSSRFTENHVRPILVFGQAQVLLNASTISSTVVNASGGGMGIGEGAVVTITGSSRVHGNNVTGDGGGLVVWDNATLSIEGNSSVSGNSAGRFGGGLDVSENANVTISGSSSVHSNSARKLGGGLLVGGNAVVVLTGGSSVHSNTANVSGGGLIIFNGAVVTITGSSRVHGNNVTSNGGGLSLWDNATLSIEGNSSVSGNSAGQFGGGLDVQDNANVTISGSSSVHSNSARNRSGGGLFVLDNAVVVLAGGSSVHSNTANFSGGGLSFWDNATVMVTGGSSVHSNIVGYGFGGGLAMLDTATLMISGASRVHSNIARNGFGGGLAAIGNGTVTISGGSSVYNNAAGRSGGGLRVHNASLILTGNSSVRNNIATMGGGGLTASAGAVVNITGGTTVHSNKAVTGTGGGLQFLFGVHATISNRSIIFNNTCSGVVGGGICVDIGSDADKLQQDARGRLVDDDGAVQQAANVSDIDMASHVIISNSTVSHNQIIRSAGGGLAVGGNGTVQLVDGAQLLRNSAVNSSGGGVVLRDSGTLIADDSVVFLDNNVSRGYIGSTIAAFGNSTLHLSPLGNLTKCSVGVYLGWSTCRAGEFEQLDMCVCCSQHTFSFTNTSDSCQQCPPHADCPGGSVVQPVPGYWSSAPTSFQMHRCPLSTTSCKHTGPGRECVEGYTGPLCGACQLPKYGLLGAFRCTKCMEPIRQLCFYLLVSLVSVFFITCTAHFTWRDNLTGNRVILVSDVIKVLVQYLQYTVIIGSVSVPWPLFDVLQRWFQVVNVVYAVGSSQGLSLDCWLFHYIPQGRLPLAMQRQLVYFLAPVLAFLAVLVVQWLAWAVRRWVVPLVWRPVEHAGRHLPVSLMRKLPVTLLVLAYYAYPTLTRASLSFFACLRIDRVPPEILLPTGATAALNHTAGYWVSDIHQQCFAGYHRGWALGLGLPSVLLWCIAVPLAMGLGLYLCRAKADEDSFREHFGFLYRSYRPERMWWEAVWAVRTVVLTLVSVFAFPMERYFSVLSLLVVFWASAVLQSVFQPYAFAKLHRMHMVSTSCLAATTLGALAMFAYDVQESTALRLRMAIALLVMLVNVGFVAWCVWQLVPVLKDWPLMVVTFMTTRGRQLVEAGMACIGVRTRHGTAGRGKGRAGCFGV